MLFYPDERGQGLLEYALIIILVAVVVIAFLALLGPTLRDSWYNLIVNAI